MLRLLSFFFPKPLSIDARVDPWVGAPCQGSLLGPVPVPSSLAPLRSLDTSRTRSIDDFVTERPAWERMGAFPHDADDFLVTQGTLGGVRADDGLWGSNISPRFDANI